MINKTHHELLIAYYKDRYNKLPHGSFGAHNGRPVIYVTYDPNNPKINSKNKRCLSHNSKDGKIYYKLIEESMKIEAKIKQLTEDWRTSYKDNPRDIPFPLKKRTTTPLTQEVYDNAEEFQNTYPYKRTIEYKGMRLRSKNELILCQALDNMGFEYKIEINLAGQGFAHLFPDATIIIKEFQKPIAIELDGAAEDDDYYEKAENRKRSYFKHGFVEHRDIIFFRLFDAYSFDHSRLDAMIKAAIYINLTDIILPD